MPKPIGMQQVLDSVEERIRSDRNIDGGEMAESNWRAVPGEGTQVYPRKDVTNSDAPYTIRLVRELRHVNVGWAYERAKVGEDVNTQFPEEFQELLERKHNIGIQGTCYSRMSLVARVCSRRKGFFKSP